MFGVLRPERRVLRTQIGETADIWKASLRVRMGTGWKPMLLRCFFCHTKIIAPKNPRITSENPPNPTFFRNSTIWQQLTSNFVTPPFRGTDPNFPTRHARPNWLAMFVAHDVPASSTLTQERLGWHPTGPGLIADLERMNWIN